MFFSLSHDLHLFIQVSLCIASRAIFSPNLQTSATPDFTSWCEVLRPAPVRSDPSYFRYLATLLQTIIRPSLGGVGGEVQQSEQDLRALLQALPLRQWVRRMLKSFTRAAYDDFPKDEDDFVDHDDAQEGGVGDDEEKKDHGSNVSDVLGNEHGLQQNDHHLSPDVRGDRHPQLHQHVSVPFASESTPSSRKKRKRGRARRSEILRQIGDVLQMLCAGVGDRRRFGGMPDFIRLVAQVGFCVLILHQSELCRVHMCLCASASGFPPHDDICGRLTPTHSF